jgi:hypothetical protein
VIGSAFGFGGVDGDQVSCEEYEATWRELHGAPRSGHGALVVHSSATTDEQSRLTAWGLPDEPYPRLGEWVEPGVQCRHWRFRWPAGAEPGCVGD